MVAERASSLMPKRRPGALSLPGRDRHRDSAHRWRGRRRWHGGDPGGGRHCRCIARAARRPAAGAMAGARADLPARGRHGTRAARPRARGRAGAIGDRGAAARTRPDRARPRHHRPLGRGRGHVPGGDRSRSRDRPANGPRVRALRARAAPGPPRTRTRVPGQRRRGVCSSAIASGRGCTRCGPSRRSACSSWVSAKPSGRSSTSTRQQRLVEIARNSPIRTCRRRRS